MKTSRTFAAAALLGWLAACIPGYAADSAAGQKTFETTCAACHKDMKSYAGKSETDLQSAIKDIVAGTKKHPKKLTLNDADIANVAAYISSNEPK
jgi:mono/diheme cytochrome c family protein